MPVLFCEKYYFYPRSPCGERRPQPPKARVLINFYPRSPCGERPLTIGFSGRVNNFYPRSPCGERRGALLSYFDRIIFLSTLSLRRATPLRKYHTVDRVFLSTLSLRRATCARCHCWGLNEFLSTLSLRRATKKECTSLAPKPFLSTLSLRRATGIHYDNYNLHCVISIHALLAESDRFSSL